jgi:hypothetical protein
MDNLSNQPSPVEESIVLSDKKDRKILSEGRNYQMGFAFCKKESHGKYSTVQPISACKDYLNDVVYSEMTGKPCAAYGLSVKKENIYDEEAGYAYMVIKILPYQRSSNYPNQEKDMQNLKENYKLLEKFINYFEEKKGLPHLSQITEIDEDRFFIRVPLFWCRATYLTSLYALLLRVGQFWKGDNSPQEYLDKFSNEFQPDSYMIPQIRPKLKKILTQEIPPQDLVKLGSSGNYAIHNFGICAVNL